MIRPSIRSSGVCRRGLAASAAMMALLAFAIPAARAEYVPGEGSGIAQALRDYACETALASSPRTPSTVQVETPSANPASPMLLDHAESPRLMAVSFDQVLGDVDEGTAFTLSLNAFTLAAARDPSAISDPGRYANGSSRRRIGASLTFGGPTEGGDSADVQRPRNVTNHVTGELKLRLYGSRDRRDRLPPPISAPDLSGSAGLVRILTESEEFHALAAAEPGEAGRYLGFLSALRHHPDLARALMARAPSLPDTFHAWLERVDRSPVVSLSLTSDTYATGFGRDLYAAALLAELPRPLPLTANLALRVNERNVHRVRNDELKLGVGTAWRFFEAPSQEESVDVSLGGAVLVRSHRRPPVWLVDTKVDVPLRSGLKLTASLFSSRHRERATESITRGTIGLSYGLGANPIAGE